MFLYQYNTSIPGAEAPQNYWNQPNIMRTQKFAIDTSFEVNCTEIQVQWTEAQLFPGTTQPSSVEFYNLAAWYYEKNVLEVRIPWDI